MRMVTPYAILNLTREAMMEEALQELLAMVSANTAVDVEEIIERDLKKEKIKHYIRKRWMELKGGRAGDKDANYN
jgi:hypothetical protein